MIPIYTSVEDMRKLLGYMSKQIGWVEQSKVEKALGAMDERKINAMVALGLLQRDGSNFKLAQRGQAFAAGDEVKALRDAVRELELYWATLEWVHYQSRSEVTATEIGQYWETSHKDTLGSLSGGTLNAGAVCFGRVAEGAGFGTFTVGRAGRETRLTINREAITEFVDGAKNRSETGADEPERQTMEPAVANGGSASGIQPTEVVTPTSLSTPPPNVSVSASPSVHVNVEIHIAADATADTVKEIFRNMARYVLDKDIDDDRV